ncbi:membrane-spanning 4-domains subfamily A member 4A-like [Varanus komodoensis]|uniref:Uncharacterized protein n=1 Tax=Varanus komodoensis TaxID=61221 RepID=A0A8D2IT06_VARKO|nr:membrane-spanning 4-domains subfamily A member 4A-like [Varanus komodoensis]
METMQLVSPSNANNLQTVQGISANFVQPPASIKSVQYVQYQGSPGNPPQQFPQLGALGKAVLRNAKPLGAIQIIIGLLHIIFAICLCFTVHFSYVHYSEIYSGIIFVASGSVSVSAKKHLNSNLVNCSVGMNIMSAIGALTGIILNVMLLALHSTLLLAGYNHLQQDMYDPAYKSMYFSENLLYGFIITFLLLKLVQFCTVVLVAHFGCRTNCCIDDVAIAYVPCTSTGGHLSPTEDCPAHLTYVKVVPYLEVL